MGILQRELHRELVAEQAPVSGWHHPGPKIAPAAATTADWRPVGAGGGFVCDAGLERAFDYLLARFLRLGQHLHLSTGERRVRLVAIQLQSGHIARPSRVQLQELQEIHAQRNAVLEPRQQGAPHRLDYCYPGKLR